MDCDPHSEESACKSREGSEQQVDKNIAASGLSTGTSECNTMHCQQRDHRSDPVSDSCDSATDDQSSDASHGDISAASVSGKQTTTPILSVQINLNPEVDCHAGKNGETNKSGKSAGVPEQKEKARDVKVNAWRPVKPKKQETSKRRDDAEENCLRFKNLVESHPPSRRSAHQPGWVKLR
jgi:hypothetical protein